MYIKNSDLHNFADDYTISSVSSSLNELNSELKKEGNIVTPWFRDNSMNVNQEKFHAIITDRKNQKNSPQKLLLDEASSENVTSLGLEVDSKLNFDEHISKLYNKSARKLNALCRIGHLIGLEEWKILINSFVYADFNYCLLEWHFSFRKSIHKFENIQKRALRFLLNGYSSDYEILLKKN